MGLRSDRLERKNLINKNHYLENSEAGFGLLANLIASPETTLDLKEELEKLQKLISKNFIELSKQQNFPKEAEKYEELKRVYDDLEDLVEFSALANKNIVAVGGGFSAGKSRFLNSILGDDILPVSTTPTTAIPSYVGKGKSDEEKIYALNTYNFKSDMDREALKAISHAFNEKYNISFSHIIKILMIEKTNFPFENIVLLDTPGYSKSVSLIKGDNTDENIARGHLAQADHLIWVVDTPKGTIPQTDIDFIKSFLKKDGSGEGGYDGDIFIVINKADLRQPEEIPKIMNIVKKTLKSANINICGMTAYNSSSKENPVVMGDSIQKFLEKTNDKIKYKKMRTTFSDIFSTFIDYNNKEILESKEMLKFLNPFYLKKGDSIDKEDLKELKQLISNNKKKIRNLTYVVNQFEKLKSKVCDTVGTIMDKINVEDHTRRNKAVCGTVYLRENHKLGDFKEGTVLEGKVTNSNCLGVFIECGLGQKAMISPDEIIKKYTRKQEEVFASNTVCKVEIIEIDLIYKKIEVVVTPTLKD